MQLALRSHSVFSVVAPFLRPLAPTIAIAIASMASFGEANAVDMMDTSEEIPDQIVFGFVAPSRQRRSTRLDISVVCLKPASIKRT